MGLSQLRLIAVTDSIFISVFIIIRTACAKLRISKAVDYNELAALHDSCTS